MGTGGGSASAPASAQADRTPSTTTPTGPAASGSGSPPAPLTEIRVSIPSPGIGFLPLYVARDQGYFRDEGLDVRMVIAAGPASVAGTIAGDFDFSGTGGQIIASASRHLPLKLIFSPTHVPTFTLFAGPNTESISQVAGQTLALAEAEGLQPRLMDTVLRAHNVDPRGVTYVPITASPARLQALQAGAVFGSVLATPDDIRAERLGMKRLAFFGDYTRAMIGGMVTADATIQNNPDLVVRFVRGMLKGIAFVKHSREAGVEALAKHLDLPLDIANEVWDIAIRSYNDDGSETDEELRNNLKLQAPDASTVQVSDVFDLRFAREAYDSLQRSGWKP